MKIHIAVNHHIRYMEYALVCMDSLINKGQVKPEDIIVTTNFSLENSFLVRKFLAKYPIHVKEYSPMEKFLQKFAVAEDVFNLFPEEDSILQLDADTLLTRDMDFLGLMKESNRYYDILSYTDYAKAKETMDNRLRFLSPDFQYQKGVRAYRLNVLTEAFFGDTFDNFYDWLGTQHWVYGGFRIVNRSFMSKKQEWDIIKAIGTITSCDETAIKLAEWSSQWGHRKFEIGKLVTPDFACVTCPKPFDINLSAGMVHYSCDGYRLHNKTNLSIVNSLVDSMAARL